MTVAFKAPIHSGTPNRTRLGLAETHHFEPRPDVSFQGTSTQQTLMNHGVSGSTPSQSNNPLSLLSNRGCRTLTIMAGRERGPPTHTISFPFNSRNPQFKGISTGQGGSETTPLVMTRQPLPGLGWGDGRSSLSSDFIPTRCRPRYRIGL